MMCSKLSLVILFFLVTNSSFAHLKPRIFEFRLESAKPVYEEGDMLEFNFFVKNVDQENFHPFLMPESKKQSKNILYFKLYDKARNFLLLRMTEKRDVHSQTENPNSTNIEWLAPNQEITIPMYWNVPSQLKTLHSDHTHTFGVPIFAGEYKIVAVYDPKLHPSAKEIYSFYDCTKKDEDEPDADVEHTISEHGEMSNLCEFVITRSNDSIVLVEGNSYYIRYEKPYWRYYLLSPKQNPSKLELIHMNNIEPGKYSNDTYEYYYNQFVGLYNEFIVRRPNGDIKEYRKYKSDCPTELLCMKFDSLNRIIYHAFQLSDGTFYNVTYNDKNKKSEENYYSEDGKIGRKIKYKYNSKGKLIKKKTFKFNPCLVIEL